MDDSEDLGLVIVLYCLIGRLQCCTGLYLGHALLGERFLSVTQR